MERPKIVCIDWDATCVKYSTDEVLPGAFEAIFHFLNDGWQVSIYTSRQKDSGEIWEVLKKHHLRPADDCSLKVIVGKPDARVYLDDRAMRFDGEWNAKLVEDIKNFMPWYVKEEEDANPDDSG